MPKKGVTPSWLKPYLFKKGHKVKKGLKRGTSKVSSMVKHRRTKRRGTWRVHRVKSKAIPLLPLMGGVIAPMAGAIQDTDFINGVQANPATALYNLADNISQRYCGYSFQNNAFNMGGMIPTYTGLIAGLIGHKLASKFGVNRAIKKVPFVGRYIQL
jgi:hypothetical protein